jgi:hypothetical protein
MATTLDTSIQLVRDAINKTSVARLSAVSGVAYTTIASFRNRGFANKSYATMERLVAAAESIMAAEDPSAIPDGPKFEYGDSNGDSNGDTGEAP